MGLYAGVFLWCQATSGDSEPGSLFSPFSRLHAKLSWLASGCSLIERGVEENRYSGVDFIVKLYAICFYKVGCPTLIFTCILAEHKNKHWGIFNVCITCFVQPQGLSVSCSVRYDFIRLLKSVFCPFPLQFVLFGLFVISIGFMGTSSLGKSI